MMIELREKFKSREWRLEHLYWIIDEKGRKVKFRLRPMQRLFLHMMWFWNIILKARQLGFTTLIDLIGLDMALFTPNFSVVIIAHRKEDAQKIFYNKIKIPYESMPEAFKAEVKAIKCDAGELILSNGSSVRVTTSSRSSTCQFLHISEYGKICAQYPSKAREIRTGALPSVHPGGYCFIESTAEGNGGDFYDKCQEARNAMLSGKKLGMQEFKFCFFPWFKHPDYVADPSTVVIPDRLVKYFNTLRDREQIELTAGQMAWYAQTEKNLGEDMHREHPSTPEEAFRVAQEGVFYKREFDKIYAENRIAPVPYDSHYPVWTSWDLGFSDDTAIWFFQFIGREIRVIDYYENSGEGLPHYAAILREKNYFYGGHMAPHDIEVHELGSGRSRVETARELGIRFATIPTAKDLYGGIENVRQMLGYCWFDEAKCAAGLRALANYRKDFNEKLGVFRDSPRHDDCSHGADSFRTGAVAWASGRMGDLRSSATRPKTTDKSAWR